MKKSLPVADTSPLFQKFLNRWRYKKQYPQSPTIDIGDLFEILFATPAFHAESQLYGTYNYVLELKEVQVGYDGEELIEILLYYLESYVKERVRGISATIQDKEEEVKNL